MNGIKHLSTVGAENHPSWNATSTMNVPTNQKNEETASEMNAEINAQNSGKSVDPMVVSTPILSLSL